MNERGPLAFSRFEALTFDCYGTLIDWETGILSGLRQVLSAPRVQDSDEDLLASFARHEAELEGGPYQPYRRILAGCMERLCTERGVTATQRDLDEFGSSVGEWPPFGDSAEALQRLSTRYRLGVITNCDDDLFASSNRRLGVVFDWVVTAQQAGSYKPNRHNFEVAFERIGLPRDRILHVAQSLFHDHVPARALGLATAWIDRRHDRPGHGATPPASVTPDMRSPDMASFADAALGS